MYRFVAVSLLVSMLCLSNLATADAQGRGGVPNGSYLQSCTNITVHRGVLQATCSAANGQRVTSSLSVSQCAGGDIQNSNGSLACSNGYHPGGYNPGRPNGYNPGGGYYPGAMPPGSYQQSCTNVAVRGSTLSGSCTSPNGQRISSSIDYNRCRGLDIQNINGMLVCGNNGGGGGGGYLPNPLPPGSYQQSCTNAYLNGSTLTATCSATNGGRVTSSLNPRQCRGGTDIANVNGRLECLNYR